MEQKKRRLVSRCCLRRHSRTISELSRIGTFQEWWHKWKHLKSNQQIASCGSQVVNKVKWHLPLNCSNLILGLLCIIYRRSQLRILTQLVIFHKSKVRNLGSQRSMLLQPWLENTPREDSLAKENWLRMGTNQLRNWSPSQILASLCFTKWCLHTEESPQTSTNFKVVHGRKQGFKWVSFLNLICLLPTKWGREQKEVTNHYILVQFMNQGISLCKNIVCVHPYIWLPKKTLRGIHTKNRNKIGNHWFILPTS